MNFEEFEHEIPYEGYVIRTVKTESPQGMWTVEIIKGDESTQLDGLLTSSEIAFERAKTYIDNFAKMKGGAVSDDAIDLAMRQHAKRKKNPKIMEVNLEESATKLLRLWGRHIAECKINDVTPLEFPQWMLQVRNIISQRGEELFAKIEKQKGDE
jgi:hypothetical protein